MDAFVDWLHTYTYVWVLCAPCDGESRPVGLGLGHDIAGYSVAGVGRFAWFPWATGRRRIEASVALFNAVRRQAVVMVPCPQKDVPFFTHLAKYGVLRRVGTIHDVDDEPVALFQTRKPGD